MRELEAKLAEKEEKLAALETDMAALTTEQATHDFAIMQARGQIVANDNAIAALAPTIEALQGHLANIATVMAEATSGASPALLAVGERRSWPPP